MIQRQAIGLFACIAIFAAIVYLNHFGNSFHFDDTHTIVDNPAIRDFRNIPQFFTDGRTSSVLPDHQTWRPLVYVSLAIDYWLGNGLKPFWFHFSTFFWFLVLTGLLLALFLKVLDQNPPAENPVASRLEIAAFAAALFAVHPAIAETVNYIIQRADLYATLGVVASLVVWANWPRLRVYGLYLIPLAGALLSKPPAMIFPALLFCYILLIENKTASRALLSSAPSLVFTAALAWLTSAMTPATFGSWASGAWNYRLTQPIVTLHYFRTFFLPTGLSADSDRAPLRSIFDFDALVGIVFVLGLIALATYAARYRKAAPIAFGLFWFLLALLPTSLYPLAEVENDHRMFFPFVGLALAAAYGLALSMESVRISGWIRSRQTRREAAAAICGVALLAFAFAASQRNEVWHSEESLWRDVTFKSPLNGRGLMNYGVIRMSMGDYAGALSLLNRAQALNPNLHTLDIDLGIANGGLHKDAEAERHFLRAIRLAPLEDPAAHYAYAVWLRGNSRLSEAVRRLNIAITRDPRHIEARHVLMDVYAQQLDADLLRRAANETLTQFPADTVARSWLAKADTLAPTAETFLNESLALYRGGKFDASIQAARKALDLQPEYAEAWINIAAAYNSESRWDDGIFAAQKAIRIQPGNQLAKNNLAWATQQKARAAK